MKNTTKVMTGILAAMLLLIVMPSVLASGEVLLNCSYYGNTPTNGIELKTTMDYYTVGQLYTTSPDNDLTFIVNATTNGNFTNATYTKFYWDGQDITAGLTQQRNTVVGNHTGAGNFSMVISNMSIGATHSYYYVIAVQNGTNGAQPGNNLSCGAGYTCTSFATNHASKANITEITCPTRKVTLSMGPVAIACGDGRCNDGETATCPDDCPQGESAQKQGISNSTILAVAAFILIVGFAISKSKK